MYFDTPRDFIGGVYDDLLYGDQPLGWDIIGRKESVRAATRETFLSYLDAWYSPERMIVGVGGRIGDDLIERLEELLGDIAPRATGTASPVAIAEPASPVRLHTKASDQAHLIIGTRSYPMDHPDRYALDLVTTVLGGGMSSRLFTEVRERRGLAYYCFGTAHPYTDAGSVYAQAGVDITRIDEAVETIVRELRKIAAEPIPTEELEKARAFFASDDFAQARAEARRVLKDAASSAQARMEAGDLIDRTDIDHGPIATAVAFVILLGLLLMFFFMNGK